MTIHAGGDASKPFSVTDMKAMRIREFGGIDALIAEEAPIPEPGPGEVRIRVHAAGVNFADILMIGGVYQLRPDPPFSPGFEAAGVIDKLGPDVAGLQVGERVSATPWYGGYADYVVLPATGAFPLPDSIDMVTAVACTVVYGTSYHALTDRGNLAAGDLLLVSGATGGIGSAAVQTGKLIGATVIAAVGSSNKVQAAVDLGADHVVLYGSDAPSLREQLTAITNGRRLDVVLDPVGGDVFDQCVRELAPGGRLLVVGIHRGSHSQRCGQPPVTQGGGSIGRLLGCVSRTRPSCRVGRARLDLGLDRIW